MEKEIEFAVFCIENIAVHLNMDPSDVYNALACDSHILTSYIIPEYAVLHTQGKDYIVEDIIGVMRQEGLVA